MVDLSSMFDGSTMLATELPTVITGHLIGDLVQIKTISVDTSLASLGLPYMVSYATTAKLTFRD